MTPKLLPQNTVKIIVFLIAFAFVCAVSLAQNPIVQENLLQGTPQSEWDALDNAPIEGFAQEFSVNKGDTVHFKIDVESLSPVPYTVKIYRLGWYNGDGARFITNVGNNLTGSLQPTFNYETVTGKADCNNWAVSAEWAVPSDAVSGIYIARLDCPSLDAKSILLFIVRDDAASSPMLFKTSDATWQAYNYYGGNSFYGAGTPVPGFTHATKLSYQRPLHLRTDKSNFFNSEYPMLRWLEKNGYNVSYTTDMDMARDASIVTPAKHKTILSVGHDEYWSKEQLTKFENARANGVHIAFFSGNEIYWKTRWEDNYQTLVCYKEGTMGENVCGGKCDPMAGVWTGLWRDGCSPAYAANDGCKPEGSFSGQMSWAQSTASIKVPDTYKNLRFWSNTSIASLGAGQTATLPYGTLGNEWDPEQFTESYPAHRIVLSNTSEIGLTHKMALYRHNSGALIFSAGTMQWAWGLDDKHDLNTATGPVQPVSTDMQQATVNLLHYMDLAAGSLQSNLVEPTGAQDLLAPATTIITPVHNSSIPGSPIIISGTAIDNGGGAIGGVEVSTDNGVTWNNATGLENWTYTFSPGVYSTLTIKVRAWDDLGNLEVPGAPGTANCITVSVTGPFKYSVFKPSYPASAPVSYTGAAVELGMKFRSSVTGSVIGFRYYKKQGITGTHIGHLWSKTGTMLAEATFINETASGWQTVMLSAPVAIDKNTTYVVSYFSASGDFSKEDPFFTQPVVNGFLRGLANGEDGGNGVYAYENYPVFPDNTFGSGNYYADVIFESNDATAPLVTSVTPPDNSTGNMLNVHPTATLDEALDPASVTRSSVTLAGPGNVLVNGSVTLTNGSLITFTPNNSLTPSTTYTVTLKGGVSGAVVKDLIGNPLTANYTWSFTTGALSSPVIVTKPVEQSTCTNGTVSFTSSANGIPTPTVQWQKSMDGGLTWANIPGATAGTYTFTAVYADNNSQYHAVWTNSQGHDISTAATLTVAEPISGSIAAVNSHICPGNPFMLQLTAASGQAPYTLEINSSVYEGINVGQPFMALLNKETIWPATTLPAQAVQADNNSVELGVKFKTNKNGVIKGIRFYKGSEANGGTHIGSLWSKTGTLLASATFVNETAVGWQEVLFSTPVEVTANTTYVASYFAPLGNYSRNGSYFVNDYSNGNSLTALKNSAEERNGVYVYTDQSAFPDNSPGDPNYWVDVVFAGYITPASATTTFNLTSMTGANGCSVTGNPISTTSITIDPVVNAGTITGASALCIGANASYTTDGDANGTWSSSNPLVASVNAAGEVTALSAGTTNIIYSFNSVCGTPSSSVVLTVDPNANAGTVTGATSLCIDATTNYSSDGDAGGSWSSTDPTVATVDANGFVIAKSAGTTYITYTVSTGCNSPVSSIIHLTVNANVNAGAVSGNAEMCIGATTVYTSNGDAGGTWSSSDPSVASVNANGLVTALSAGTTNIIYSINTGCNSPVSSFSSLTVNPDLNAGSVTGASALCIGANASYTSNGDAGGTWSSSDPSVATVNNNGLVTALSAGTVQITYTVSAGCNGPVSSFKMLTVNPDANAGTVFSGVSTLCIGTTITYTSNGDAGGTWSSSNPSVASVNANGLVTALTPGNTNITYTVSEGCNSPVASFILLTISPVANVGTVSGASALCIGASAAYTNNGDLGGTWSSSNPTVASVNAAGLVTALSAGTTNITYTISTNCSGILSAFKMLTVDPNVTAGTVSGTAPLCIGSTGAYTCNGNAGGVWSSSDPSVASVNANGLVTALSAGTTNIIYTVNTGCGGPVSSFKALTVSANVTAGTVSGAGPLCIGTTATYTSNGTASGTWSSSNPSVASVNAAGLVTALAAGTTNITYTVSAGCGGPVSSFKALTVNPNISAGTVSGNSPLCIGSTATYTSNGNAGGVWSSSNPSVASVNAAGLVTALTAGTTNITYTISTGCGSPSAAFKTLTVNPNGNAGTVSGASPLCIGATATYTSNGNTGGTWSSSNPSVASVNAAGLVTALAAGTTNITYTVNTGCGGAVSSLKALTVSANVIAGTVSGTSPLCIGATATYTSNGTTGGVWSSSNPAVASVSAAGLVTALAAGTTNITYTVSAGCGGPVSSFKTLTVNPNVSAGTVSGASPMCKSATATYTSNGTTGGTWSSSNPSVASVNAAGLVTAIASGTTNITYTVSTGCGGPVSSFKTLTVGAVTNTSTVSGTSPLCIGVSTTYTTNALAGGTWSSSNPAVATVNAVGLVKALTAGTTIITYTVSTSCSGSVATSKTLTVSPNANAGTVSGTTPSCSLQTTQFTSNGDPGGTWSSSNPLVGFVWPSGYVTALFFGTANITYTVNTGCNAPVSSYRTIQISLFAYSGIVNGNSPICKGTTTAYTSNGSQGGVWSSSNTSVATVNASGNVTAVGAGTAVIKYTVSSCTGSASSSKTITVNPITVANAGAITGSSPMCINATANYTSNGNTGGVWTSSNTTVASVNATTGAVKALASGTTTISYKVTPSCGTAVTAVKTLTVNNCSTFAGSTQSRTSANDDVINKITKVESTTKSLVVEAYPNPSNTEFTVQLKGYSNDKVLIIVTDLLGKRVYQTEGMNQQQYKFGKNLVGGMYLLKVIQAGNSQTIKLIKE